MILEQTVHVLLLSAAVLLLTGCVASPTQQDSAEMTDDNVRMAPCPALPNCVCSDASNPMHAIAPIRVSGEPAKTWAALLSQLENDPRYTIVEQSGDYIHAEARTRLMGFVDDVEFELRAEEIAVRSASRVGLFDLGANRLRINALRKALDDS